MAGWRFWRRSRRSRKSAVQTHWERMAREGAKEFERKYLLAGTRRDGGSRKPSASTGTKEHGTRTPGTATTAGCSSFSPPGALSAVSLDPTLPARVSSYTVPGTFTFVTGGRGVSGEPLGSAD